jgi:crotonobetainyl-CoA:carnitine CoA-transferase CaiB-like acyl-CoA transferase
VNVDFLAGARVLELGDGVAGASAAGLLAALGAEVTSVVNPLSPHRHGRPRVDSADTGPSLLGTCLDRGKVLVEAPADEDPATMLQQAYDLVVVDRVMGGRGVLGSLDGLDEYLAFVDQQNKGAWLTISAFGLTGPRAGDVATELTVAAASGMLGAVRDERTGQPLKLGGQQSLLNTGQAAALAGCHALDLAGRGRPVHLDLSAVEATLAMGPVLEVGSVLLATGSAGGAKRYGAPASFYGCSDGEIRISAMEDHQWLGVVAAMGSPPWAERFATAAARIESADEVDAYVEKWTRGRSKGEAEAELQAHGVPATAVYSPAEILDSPQLDYRHAFDVLPVSNGCQATIVGLPFGVVSGGNSLRGDRRRRRSLLGLRVLEASRVLAVPLAGAILGALGAEVSKLEDLSRLDMYRRRGPYIEGEAGPERSAYFALMNHTKASVAFDVDADRQRLEKLVEESDVVIENLGPKRATALGMAASTAPGRHPGLLAVSSSGFGQSGPRADYRAYAYNLQASGALGYLTRNESGESAEIDIAWADLISAYALATIIAAWAVGPMGNAGAGIDFSMTDLVVSHFNEYLAAASLGYQDDTADRANELAPFAPHGVYPTDDGWIAICVRHDDEYARLAKVFEDRQLLAPNFESAADRLAHRLRLDARLALATQRHIASELASKLRAEGVIAEAVVDARTLTQDPQLAARAFFPVVVHPEWGSRRLVGIPWRAFGHPPPPLGSSPLLGGGSVAPEWEQS